MTLISITESRCFGPLDALCGRRQKR